MRQRDASDCKILFAIRHAAVILAPSEFAGIGSQISARDMMMVADLRAAHAGEEAFRLVRASAFGGIVLIVVDTLREEGSVKAIPMGGFVRVNGRRCVNASLNCRNRRAL